MDYPTLKSMEDNIHPDMLVPNDKVDGLRKYFCQLYLQPHQDKFDQAGYDIHKSREAEEEREYEDMIKKENISSN
jgi:hypothetical protein